MLQFFAGIYFGIGIGYALWCLAEVGFGAGLRLIWRVPLLICFWPGLYAAALARC